MHGSRMTVLQLGAEQLELTELTESPAVAVPAKVKRPVRGFIALIAMTVIAGFLAILTLNMAIAQGAFSVALLEDEAAFLNEREQSLLREVAQLESPSSLARKAASLGMQPSAGGSFLRLEDGTMVGPGVPKRLQRPVGANKGAGAR